MGKYDLLPHRVNQVKDEIARKEQELADLKKTLAILNAKSPKSAPKAVKVEKSTKDE